MSDEMRESVLAEMSRTTASLAPPTQPAPAVWRSGKWLVVMDNTRLEGFCIRCNAPVDERRVKRTLYWHHPAIYLLIPVGILIYAIVALILRRRVTVYLGVCRRHRLRRWGFIAISWLAALGAIVLFGAGIGMENGAMIAGGVALFFAALIFAVITVPLVTPKRIDGRVAFLRRVCPAFLARYPEYPRQW